VTHNPAVAGDIISLSNESAINTEDAQNKLDKNIKLHFGEEYPGETVKEIAASTRNGSTTAGGNACYKRKYEDYSPVLERDIECVQQARCHRAFISALLSLQAQARAVNAYNVSNISSNIRKQPFTSKTNYECETGHLMSHVVLTGVIVK